MAVRKKELTRADRQRLSVTKCACGNQASHDEVTCGACREAIEMRRERDFMFTRLRARVESSTDVYDLRRAVIDLIEIVEGS